MRSPSEEAPFAELACAKVNLSLRVHGRRPDGYHELESLVAFAGGCAVDRVTLVPGGPLRLEVGGPGSGSLTDIQANLIIRAAEAALRLCPSLTLGAFQLEKHLPVAAGLGGGSADAAAALRLIRRANPAEAGSIDWLALAASIGADVPVCMASRVSRMAGIGERIEPFPDLPPVWAVLANPGVALATRDVFQALGAPPLNSVRPVRARTYDGLPALIVGLRDLPNDLEATAKRLCPVVADVCAALIRLDGSLLARMSGSGPTCFALFATAGAAAAAARSLRSAEPRWWVEAAPLR